MTRLLTSVVATLAPLGAARADVAPPDDYVDPCAAMTFDENCRRCTVPEFKSRDCHEGARAAELVERCRGWNYAMYCGKDGGSPTSPKPRNVPGPPAEPRSASESRPDVSNPPATLAPGQPPAPSSAPPPAAATGGGCTIDGGRDATGLVFALFFTVLRRRRGST